MIMTTKKNPLHFALLYMVFIIPFISSCQEKRSLCEIPSHWLKESDEKPELTPRSVVTVNAFGAQLNGRSVDDETLKRSLQNISEFEQSELIDINISRDLPCEKFSIIVKMIDQSANCKKSSYCRINST